MYPPIYILCEMKNFIRFDFLTSWSQSCYAFGQEEGCRNFKENIHLHFPHLVSCSSAAVRCPTGKRNVLYDVRGCVCFGPALR